VYAHLASPTSTVIYVRNAYIQFHRRWAFSGGVTIMDNPAAIIAVIARAAGGRHSSLGKPEKARASGKQQDKASK